LTKNCRAILWVFGDRNPYGFQYPPRTFELKTIRRIVLLTLEFYGSSPSFIQIPKKTHRLVCLFGMREWGMLSHSRLLFTAVVKFSFGWRFNLDGFLHRQADLCQITVCFLYAYGLEAVKYICVGVERYFYVRVSHKVL